MTTNLPLASFSESTPEESLSSDSTSPESKLARCRERHSVDGSPALWTGTREGLIATVIAVVASLLFGGAAGAWFNHGGWFVQALVIAGGSMAMAALVSLTGALLTGRNAIFWGMGMPLLVYGAGSFCAFISGHAGAKTFFVGAPLFCGLAILAGVMTALVLDRGR